MGSSDVLVIGVRSVAEYIGVSRTTVYRMIERNEFPASLVSISGKSNIKAWNKADLDVVRAKVKPPGRPAGSKGVAKSFHNKVLELEKQNLALCELVVRVQKQIKGGL